MTSEPQHAFPLRRVAVRRTLEPITTGSSDSLQDRVQRAVSDSGIRVLKQENNRGVYRSEAESLVLKLRTPALKDRFRRQLFTSELEGYRSLSGLGLSVPQAVATFTAVNTHGKPVHGLAVEHIHAPTLLAILRDRQPKDTDRISKVAEQIGRAAVTIATNGLMHKDMKPSNILIPGDPDSAPTFIDPQGVRAARRAETVEDVLVRIGFALLVEPVGVGCGLPRQAVQAYLGVIRGTIVDNYSYRGIVADLLRRHGDPSPKTTPT